MTNRNERLFEPGTVINIAVGVPWETAAAGRALARSQSQQEPIDYDAEYKIDGDTVTFDHSDGSDTHRWTVDGDTLSLEFVKGTMPPYEGIPDEVYQRALYMTETFTRQD